jgi:hypothetical protein
MSVPGQGASGQLERSLRFVWIAARDGNPPCAQGRLRCFHVLLDGDAEFAGELSKLGFGFCGDRLPTKDLDLSAELFNLGVG